MVAKWGAILLTSVLAQNEVFSEDDVDVTSLLSLRGVVQTRPSCSVTSAGAKQVYYQAGGECREVEMGTVADNDPTTGATCPSGYMPIIDHSECHEACDALDHVHKWRPTTTNNNQPNGCFTAVQDPAGNCHFNINNEGNDDKSFIPFYLANSKSMCMKQTGSSTTESLKAITVITKTKTTVWAGSKANFYISFPGDERKYQLDTPMRDRKKGATDTFQLVVSANADVTGPTIQINSGPTVQIKETKDGWRIKSIKIIDETDHPGAQVKLKTLLLPRPNGVVQSLPLKSSWLDGNCKFWQGMCAKSWTLKP